MFKRILLATSDRDLGELVQSYLEDAEDGFDPTVVGNGKSFGRKLAGDGWRNFDLLIIDNGVYPDRQSRPPKNANTGLDQLRDLKARGVDLPSILLIDQLEATLLTETQRLQNCELVMKQGVLDESISVAMDRLQLLDRSEEAKGADKAADYDAVIEINISSEAKQDYRFRYRTSTGWMASPPKPLAIRWHIHKELCESSKAVGELKT
ncbi:MAG: hypothetical protein O7I42_25245, partial [Alphaproteobacteria bacterium]|nr:hypothetical protein [Alphaproteobacteria bacterium]